MPTNSEKVNFELDYLQKQNNGVLHPNDIVEYAKDPGTALHGQFEWSDSKAAELYRLNQARNVIRCYVKIVDEKVNEPVRAFVSLSSDRNKGYQKIERVMKNPATRNQLLIDAIADMVRFKKKYNTLKELAGVFKAADVVIKDHEPIPVYPQSSIQPLSL